MKTSEIITTKKYGKLYKIVTKTNRIYYYNPETESITLKSGGNYLPTSKISKSLAKELFIQQYDDGIFNVMKILDKMKKTNGDYDPSVDEIYILLERGKCKIYGDSLSIQYGDNENECCAYSPTYHNYNLAVEKYNNKE